jgi:hypothetical protein
VAIGKLVEPTIGKEELERYVAPCSLLCYTCGGFKDGVIAESARLLRHYLSGLEGFGSEERKSVYKTLFSKLEQFAGSSCPGCRNCEKRGCMIRECQIPTCIREKGVSFCFQCNEFPCDKNDFRPKIKNKWISGNKRIAEVGLKRYFEENREVPHYK